MCASAQSGTNEHRMARRHQGDGVSPSQSRQSVSSMSHRTSSPSRHMAYPPGVQWAATTAAPLYLQGLQEACMTIKRRNPGIVDCTAELVLRSNIEMEYNLRCTVT